MYNVLCNKTYLSKENTEKLKVTADQFLTHGYQKKYVDSILFYFDWRWYGSVFLVNFVSQLPNLAINLLICEAWGYLNLYKFTCIISLFSKQYLKVGGIFPTLQIRNQYFVQLTLSMKQYVK